MYFATISETVQSLKFSENSTVLIINIAIKNSFAIWIIISVKLKLNIIDIELMDLTFEKNFTEQQFSLELYLI